ncbi:MAG: porin, partial [Ectopseudomonas oleovorans]
MIRKHFAGFAASALALAVSAQAFAGTVTTDGADLVIKTKGGLEVGTTDKEFSFKINGRLQVDADSFDGFYTKNGERADETYLRRARLEISGVAFTDWGYTFQRNFGDDSSNWRELAIHYNGWEPVQISVGRIRPTFGLEWATSSKWITAIERSALSDLAPWVNSEDGEGIRVRTTVGMFHGEAGAYRQDADMLEDENGANNTSFVLRGVIAPIVEKDQVLHLGASFGKRDLEEGYLESIRPRLSVRGTTEDRANGNRATFGGTRTDGSDQVWGLEAAYMIGPFSVQGEYRTRTVDAMEGFEDLEATGYN